MHCPKCGANAHKKSTDPYWHCLRHGPQFSLTMPSPCGDVVVVHEGRVLMIERAREPDKGGWAFPGGHIEPREDPEAGAYRELQEETGLCVAHLDIQDSGLLYSTIDGNNLVVVYYLSLSSEPELNPNEEEVSDYLWTRHMPSGMALWRAWPFQLAQHLDDQRILLP